MCRVPPIFRMPPPCPSRFGRLEELLADYTFQGFRQHGAYLLLAVAGKASMMRSKVFPAGWCAAFP
jgi:hypothetical protein